MNSLLIVLLFFLFFAVPANAEFYRWIDKNGVIHFVDDLHKVPQEERHQLGLDLEELEKEAEALNKRGIQHTVPIKATTDAPSKAFIPSKKLDPGAELFGDKTLEWWRRTISRLKRERSELTQSIAAKDGYIKVYQSGRSFGRIYLQESIDRYDRYNKELFEDRKLLTEKETLLEDLLRSAKSAGVPRKIRGD